MWCCRAALPSERTVGKLETILRDLKFASFFIENCKPWLEHDLLWGWKMWSWWVFKKKKSDFPNLCPYLIFQDTDNCINLKRKRNIEGICTVSTITGEVWGEQAFVWTFFACSLEKSSWNCREVSHAQGLECPLQCPISAGMHAQQIGCVLAAFYPAHANFSAVTLSSFCYQEDFLLTKTRDLLWQKISWTGTHVKQNKSMENLINYCVCCISCSKTLKTPQEQEFTAHTVVFWVLDFFHGLLLFPLEVTLELTKMNY